MDSRVDALYVASTEGKPMATRRTVQMVPGGVENDRYYTERGYYSPLDVCEVTFMSREAIETVRAEYGIDVADGEHRRNVVTTGVDLRELLESRFRVGGAVLEGTRPRPPCAHVEHVAEKEGLARALTGGRGGICADVVDGGEVSVGDDIEVLANLSFDGDALAAAIRRRQ